MTLLRPALAIAGSTALYYLLRHLGVGVYAALVVGAVLSLLPAVVALVRGRRPGGLEAFFTVLLFASFAIALLPGDPRFLLAKDALITGGVGCWFLASLWLSDRPLAYQFAKPMVEGRWAWPDDWEGRWERDPGFRRMWRTSSALWAIGTLLDAVGRVVMAYARPSTWSRASISPCSWARLSCSTSPPRSSTSAPGSSHRGGAARACRAEPGA